MKDLRPLPELFHALVLLCLSAMAAATDGAVPLPEYGARLQEISQQVQSLGEHRDQAGNVIARIPDEVTVSTGSAQIKVNYRPLKDALTQFSQADNKTKPERLKAVNVYIASLERDAAAFASSPEQVDSIRQKTAEILARREFRNVQGPGLKETLLGKLYRWLSRILQRMHLGGAGATTILQVLIYVLVGAALLLLLIWTLKRLRRTEEELPVREIIPFSPSAKSWRVWLAEAGDFAAKQDWRNAIHLAYWAGISFLESGGAWKPNRARTPREYLDLLSTRNPHHPPLSALTRKFEVVWYGDRPAGRQDFQETLGQLEKLGCR